jgi:transposase-like protein
VEIDEAYLGGRLRHHGSKVAKASKTMVIGMAEHNGRVHLESMSNRQFESIKPVLDAKLAEDTKEVVTDGNPTYKRLIPKRNT